MDPVRALVNTLSSALAADTAFLANASAMKLAPIIANFTPSLDRVIGDLTLGSAEGLAPLAMTAGAQNESTDPVTGELVVEVKAPVGGARFELTGVSGAPYTVYGFALINNAVSALIGMYKLDTPVVMNAINQAITAPPEALEFRIDPTKVH